MIEDGIDHELEIAKQIKTKSFHFIGIEDFYSSKLTKSCPLVTVHERPIFFFVPD
jgi:hypothetical protein